MRSSKQVAIIGGGAMGLTTAYHLCRLGISVDVYEVEDRLGGMLATTEFSGMQTERYYHYVCGPDFDLFKLLHDLGISHALKWSKTKMGFYYQGKLYPWGSPFDLLKFPEIAFLTRLRYGYTLYAASRRHNWHPLDKRSARDWMEGAIGKEAYEVFWQSLFHYKFYEYTDQISAAFLWSRIRRMARSKPSLWSERLGYIDGSCETLVHALQSAISAQGGKCHCSAPVSEVVVSRNKVQGIIVHGEFIPYQRVISTMPLPYISRTIPNLPDQMKVAFDAVNNVGVICVLLKLNQPLTNCFWLNINDSRMSIPGLVEYSNLVPTPSPLIYVPYYMPASHAWWTENDEFFIDQVTQYCSLINPDFKPSMVQDTLVSRSRYAQPVCTMGLLDRLPAIGSGVDGLFIADTTYYYPEDRSISESARVGRQLADYCRASFEHTAKS